MNTSAFVACLHLQRLFQCLNKLISLMMTALTDVMFSISLRLQRVRHVHSAEYCW